VADEATPFRYVSIDPDGEIIRLRLPPGTEHYRSELLEDLTEEFSFEPRSATTEQRMNEYVETWLARHRASGSGA
jgi:hypothetical protein